MIETVIKNVPDPMTGKDVKITAVYKDGILISQTTEINFGLYAMPLCQKCNTYHKGNEYCPTDITAHSQTGER